LGVELISGKAVSIADPCPGTSISGTTIIPKLVAMKTKAKNGIATQKLKNLNKKTS
jgi:hypothetical protein